MAPAIAALRLASPGFARDERGWWQRGVQGIWLVDGERLQGRWLAQDVNDPDEGFAVSLWDSQEDMQAYEQSEFYQQEALPAL